MIKNKYDNKIKHKTKNKKHIDMQQRKIGLSLHITERKLGKQQGPSKK